MTIKNYWLERAAKDQLASELKFYLQCRFGKRVPATEEVSTEIFQYIDNLGLQAEVANYTIHFGVSSRNGEIEIIID